MGLEIVWFVRRPILLFQEYPISFVRAFGWPLMNLKAYLIIKISKLLR